MPILTLGIALAAFYLYRPAGVGLLGPDEPRYAAIGQAMAGTHDLVTPRLWGSPWFEKPPLLYWLVALGRAAGWQEEMAARLPVALLSLAFLGLYWALLRNEFGARAASVATFLLGTSVGWIAYSELCLTDLPLAAFYALAVLVALPLTGDGPAAGWRWWAAGACIGFATLAKGLVPIALLLPVAWFCIPRWRAAWRAALAFVAVAGPWYLAVSVRHGGAFWQEFFVRHHLERLYSSTLQHVQPPYYYLLVAPLAVLPWTPLFLLLRPSMLVAARRQRVLTITILFGLVLFSVTRNKLPGYLLPLLPLAFALLGTVVTDQPLGRVSRLWLLPCAIFIGWLPLAAGLLSPLLNGVSLWRALQSWQWTPIVVFYALLPLAAVVLARRSWAGAVLVLSCVATGFLVKETVYPILDRDVSARGFWRENQTKRGQICNPGINRTWEYGLYYYNGAVLPRCAEVPMPYVLVQQGHAAPYLERLGRAGL